VDGGLLGAMPLWAAAEMGAERVVAVDALPKLPSPVLRAAVRMVQRIAPRVPAAVPARIVRIGRDTPLGSVRDALYWSPANVERWMAWGADDAARCFRLE
jgi:predicted acylesterase/phospholipase RssA